MVGASLSIETCQCSEPDFTVRVMENQRRVFQIAYSVLGNRADAEEVAQETFLSAYQKFNSLRSADRFRAWVNRIAFRRSLNRQRAQRRRIARDTAWYGNTITDGPTDGIRNTEQARLLDELRRQIERLPDKYKTVIQLSIVEEMNAANIGAVLGIPEGTVRSRLHAARKLLLETMR